MDKPIFSRRNPERKRRPSTVTIPERAGPHVRLLFAELKRQNITYDELQDRSGILRTTVKAWRTHNAPSLTCLEAAFNTLGWDFVAVPRERALPPEVVAELRLIAERLDMTMPAAIEALVAIVAGIHNRFEPPPLAAEPEALIAA